MKKRLKSLLALIMTWIICMQILPTQVYAEMQINGTEYTLTTDSSADGYVVQSGGVLRFADGLTVNGDVRFAAGSGSMMYLIIPETATMNGNITFGDQMGVVQNAGTINRDISLQNGTIQNSGKMTKVVVESSGILYVKDGATFESLDVSTAGSGMLIASGSITADTLHMNPYALSTMDSGASRIKVTNLVRFSGTVEMPDICKVDVSDTTLITTDGRSGFSVWQGDVKYPLPAVVMENKKIGEIYSAEASEKSIMFTEKAVGYQTTEKQKFTVTNKGMADIYVKYDTSSDWDDMFKVTVSDSEEMISEIAEGGSVTYTVETKKGLASGNHEGTLKLQFCTVDGDVFETQEIKVAFSVKKEPSISVPSGEFYSLSGTKGKNGFYTSNVKVLPMEGFSIAKTLSDEFEESVTYSESTKKPAVYLQKNTTGQITEKAELKSIKIDKNKPKVKNVDDKETYYKDKIIVTVSDENLESVKLNSNPLVIADGKASVSLMAADDRTKYTIEAQDLAGNTKRLTFYLMPEWRKDGTIPGGKAVSLYKGTEYKLGSGYWKVGSDPTNYSGGNSFYVSGDGTYTFQSAN